MLKFDKKSVAKRLIFYYFGGKIFSYKTKQIWVPLLQSNKYSSIPCIWKCTIFSKNSNVPSESDAAMQAYLIQKNYNLPSILGRKFIKVWNRQLNMQKGTTDSGSTIPWVYNFIQFCLQKFTRVIWFFPDDVSINSAFSVFISSPNSLLGSNRDSVLFGIFLFCPLQNRRFVSVVLWTPRGLCVEWA